MIFCRSFVSERRKGATLDGKIIVECFKSDADFENVG